MGQFTFVNCQKFEPKYSFQKKLQVLWLSLLIGASYKGKLPHSEISVKLQAFLYSYQTILRK
jgi:hypothetical protein